jgi:phospholipase C
MGALQGIEHVVVLMLENRSFDSMFGALYPGREGFDGLTGTESNSYIGSDGKTVAVQVWNDDGMSPATATIPDPDPGEYFTDINQQLFGAGGPATEPPPMDGFAANYVAQKAVDGDVPDAYAVMHHFTPKQVPVIAALAEAFGVSDQWYASAPCQTWPNRFFAHSATCAGYVDNSHFPVPYTQPTIFHRLQQHQRSWRVYFQDVPQAMTIRDLWLDAPFRFRHIDDFIADAAAGSLPNYSFIEPQYFTDGPLNRIPNDEHPPHNVVYGEQLIAGVYNALRAAPTWKKTLLIITYDEHGGIFDHMPPPRAVPPDALRPDGFAFDRYGVRVPAVIVSPYMPPGSIVRVAEDGLPHQGPPYPFDHTSIIATLRKLFDLGPPLTARDAAAPDLFGALSLADPVNDGPPRLDPTPAQPSRGEVVQRAAAPGNSNQRNLCRAAAAMPLTAAGTAAPSAGASATAARGAGPASHSDAQPFVTGWVKAALGR